MTKGLFLSLGIWWCGQLMAADKDLRVLYTANRQGEIAPCACQTKQVGGLNRFAAYVEQAKATMGDNFHLILDAGDTFFQNQSTLEENQEKAKIKALTIARVYQKMGVAAVLPGERDYALGLDYLKEIEKETGAEFITSNLKDLQGNPPFKKQRVFKRGEMKVAVLGLVDPEHFKVSGLKVEDPFLVLEESLKGLKEEKDLGIVILSHLGLNNDHKILSAHPEVFIFGAHSMDALAKPILANVLTGSTGAIFQPFIEGQQIGDVRIQFHPSKVLDHQLVDLGIEFEKETPASQAIKEGVEKIKQSDKKRANASTPSFVAKHPFVANANKCRQCHEEQYEFWKSTKHASAYLVLYSKNQHFDPDCVGCHSLGFQDPNGFKSVSRAIETNEGRPKALVEQLFGQVFEGKQEPLDSRRDSERYQKLKKRYHATLEDLEKKQGIKKYYLDVQCEHCHGNRDQHPNISVKRKKAIQFNVDTCKSCHRPPNAPEFDPTKLPLVSCPKLK